MREREGSARWILTSLSDADDGAVADDYDEGADAPAGSDGDYVPDDGNQMGKRKGWIHGPNVARVARKWVE